MNKNQLTEYVDDLLKMALITNADTYGIAESRSVFAGL